MFLLKRVVFWLLVLSAVSGCRAITGNFHRSGVEFNVQIASDSSVSESITKQAISQIQGKLNLLGIDGDVTKVDGKPEELNVKVYDLGDAANRLNRIKNILFTSHQLELKKIVSSPAPAALQSYMTEQEARKTAKDNEEILPYKDAAGISKFLIVEKETIVANNDIRDAGAINSRQNPAIGFSLNPEGAKKLGEWTDRNIGNYLAIVLDKKVVSAANIRSRISDSGLIEGKFSQAEADEIVMSLKSGDAPLTFKILNEKPI